MQLCEICGNELEGSARVCPFCGSSQKGGEKKQKKPFRQKIVNIEQGKPYVEDAMRHLEAALAESKTTGVTILTVIHGYGSSGKGGRIREECRKTLDYKCSRGELGDVMPGEEFRRRHPKARSWLQRFPKLISDRNLDKGNKGVTLVVL